MRLFVAPVEMTCSVVITELIFSALADFERGKGGLAFARYPTLPHDETVRRGWGTRLVPADMEKQSPCGDDNKKAKTKANFEDGSLSVLSLKFAA
jgi:hypothetical protein